MEKGYIFSQADEENDARAAINFAISLGEKGSEKNPSIRIFVGAKVVLREGVTETEVLQTAMQLQ